MGDMAEQPQHRFQFCRRCRGFFSRFFGGLKVGNQEVLTIQTGKRIETGQVQQVPHADFLCVGMSPFSIGKV